MFFAGSIFSIEPAHFGLNVRLKQQGFWDIPQCLGSGCNPEPASEIKHRHGCWIESRNPTQPNPTQPNEF